MEHTEQLEDLIKELQYRYAWLLADFNTLFKTKKVRKKYTVWSRLYAKAREANTRILSSESLTDAHELIGAYWVLQSVMDDELAYTAEDKRKREEFIQNQFVSAKIHGI